MFTKYISSKLHKAKYKLLEDGTYFAEIPELSGVWANAKNLEKCREDLQEILEDWAVMQIAQHQKIQGLSLRVPKIKKQYA